MDRPFFARQLEAVRAAVSAGMGCTPFSFEVDELTIVDRPDSAPSPYIAMVATFGIGTVASVDPSYRAFFEALPAGSPRSVFSPPFLAPLAAEAQRRDQRVVATPTALLWALSAPPAPPEVPAGLVLRPVDRAWMTAEQSSGSFENGAGEAGVAARAERNQYGFALVDGAGEPVAVGGVFDTLGLLEIGVDVVPGRRGEGLAPIVVAAAARAILDAGEVPFYACEATNIRSQRTALACGFLPVASDAFVS